MSLGLFAKRLPGPGGERRVAAAMIIVAFVGAIVAGRTEEHLLGHVQVEGWYHTWIIFSGMIGAAAGLGIALHNQGHSGRSGLLRLCWALVSGTFLAALIGGSLALPLYGTMFGPMLIALVFTASPWLAVLWLAAFLITHTAMVNWRRERRTIRRWNMLQTGLAAG